MLLFSLINKHQNADGSESGQRQQRNRDKPKPFDVLGRAGNAGETRRDALRNDVVVDEVVIYRDGAADQA